MTEKVCTNCQRVITKNVCAYCGSTSTTTDWKGYVIIIDPENSDIAKKLKIEDSGKYALKVR